MSAPGAASPPPGGSGRALALCALAVALGTVWLRPGPPLLGGVDAGCYARVAREMAERPPGAWPQVTLGGRAFYEHPPAGPWLESLVFRVAGASSASAVLYARLVASALLAALFLAARRLAGTRAAGYGVASLVLLPGFLYETQNPMLELPLTLGLALALLGALLLGRTRTGGSALFALGFTLAAFSKGPPALAALPLLAWCGVRGLARWRDVLLALVAALGLLALAVALFEGARAAQGLAPFFPTYLGDQVRRSALQGRHNAFPGAPFFYLGTLKRWYLAALLALPLSVWAWRRQGEAGRRLLEAGWLLAAVVVVGFSLPVQKSPWYIHPVMLGAGLYLGGTLAALLPPRLDRALAGLLLGGALAVGAALAWSEGRRATPRGELEALYQAPAPHFAPGEARRVAHCGGISTWRAEHLYAFLWGAERVACEERAPYRFDGRRLVRLAPQAAMPEVK